MEVFLNSRQHTLFLVRITPELGGDDGSKAEDNAVLPVLDNGFTGDFFLKVDVKGKFGLRRKEIVKEIAQMIIQNDLFGFSERRKNAEGEFRELLFSDDTFEFCFVAGKLYKWFQVAKTLTADPTKYL